MKNILFILLFSLTICTCVRAQDHYDGLDFVQGPVYIVYDHPLGTIVYWEDDPVSVAQITTTDNGVIEVSPPRVAAHRLLIYLSADDRSTWNIKVTHAYPARRKQRKINTFKI